MLLVTTAFPNLYGHKFICILIGREICFLINTNNFIVQNERKMAIKMDACLEKSIEWSVGMYCIHVSDWNEFTIIHVHVRLYRELSIQHLWTISSISYAQQAHHHKSIQWVISLRRDMNQWMPLSGTLGISRHDYNSNYFLLWKLSMQTDLMGGTGVWTNVIPC